MAEKQKLYVAIAGNIGVGKTTLTRMLSEKLGWKAYYERVIDNPYLADFYGDMKRWSFHLQVFFLSNRFITQKEITEWPASCIQDRSIYEDAEIFARNLYDQGSMEARDYSTYTDLYHAVTAILPPPNLVIYLRASVNTLLKRIQQRGRAYERQISVAYLEKLNALYEDWFHHFTLCPILTIPADRLDYVANDDHLALVITRILERLQGKEVVSFD